MQRESPIELYALRYRDYAGTMSNQPKRTSWLTPAERIKFRNLAVLRMQQGRPDLAAACLRIANRR